ncbi:hypothetical protein [Nocardioides marmotae]|uniref:hypothetical protein n=1 Tax=Nocardioides marmotae TaxID=2663857 RepID=UPI0012B5823E|nr:hypothetical protein [Nocardioides marmotae]MBC9733695.1 hypothetical protein [Nocardioides marmotae]MTB84798.1 hypothetical protein [Nocardioides marmotae]
MPRLLLAAVPFPATSRAVSGTAPGDGLGEGAAEALTRLARALRDAGHEVVHAGQGVDDGLVVAAAVQEDVEVVVLLAPASYDAGELAARLAGEDPSDGAETTVLVVATAHEQPAQVVRRVASGTAVAVADDTPGDPLGGG